MQKFKSNSSPVGQPALKTEASAVLGASREQIADLAYQLYLKSGGQNGRDLENWLAAERQLLSQRNHEHPPKAEPAAARRLKEKSIGV
jgi:hypothetical protein